MRLDRAFPAALLVFALAGCAAHTSAPGPAAGAAPPSAGAPAGWQLDWARDAVFYEVFVRSFSDSNGDGVGDLQGLIDKLDYLNDGDPRTTTDLGVTALWLMPIFKSPSYHGYDVTDYETIQRAYGTNEDFGRLCREAHRRGIKVIVDLVMNHTSWQHPWFMVSVMGPATGDPSKRDWYLWRKDDPGWLRPWLPSATWHHLKGTDGYYYGLFYGGMPDLDYRNAEVREEMRFVSKLWLDRGVDGFRLDAARYLIETPDGQVQDTEETHAYWREFSAHVRSINPGALLVGENWTDTATIATYYGDTAKVPGGDELPMNFDFPVSDAIRGALKTGDAGGLAAQLRANQAAYPAGAMNAPFLTNHDQIRIATQLGGDAGKLRTAAALLLTLPGTPFLYYGEEVGVRQPDAGDDEFKRTPMPWGPTPVTVGFTTGKPWMRPVKGFEKANVKVQSADPASLLSRYRTLIRVRQGSAALRHGTLQLLPSSGGLLAYVRKSGSEEVLVVHNVGTAAAGLELPVSGKPAPLLVDAGVAATGGERIRVELPGLSTGVWTLKR
ncbi:MAG: alpha-amylase family glycosyl hydrolase [Anaeromyxobacter sp.]